MGVLGPPLHPAPFLRSIQGKAVSTSLVPAILSFVPPVGEGGVGWGYELAQAMTYAQTEPGIWKRPAFQGI